MDKTCFMDIESVQNLEGFISFYFYDIIFL